MNKGIEITLLQGIDRALRDCSADADEASFAIRRMADTQANKARVLQSLIEVLREDNGLCDYGDVISSLEEAQEHLMNVYRVEPQRRFA